MAVVCLPLGCLGAVSATLSLTHPATKISVIEGSRYQGLPVGSLYWIIDSNVSRGRDDGRPLATCLSRLSRYPLAHDECVCTSVSACT
ncbi:hypothetical protein GGR52DRAFT_377585 [Hypoxylon sp. FL1284]|nr:hypothetical protein GGR52DRAFT_377585 [Hypoxylon sp. FL1284]